MQKKIKKSNDGKYGNWRVTQTDRQTDGQTAGSGYIGPADRQGGSKKFTYGRLLITPLSLSRLFGIR